MRKNKFLIFLPFFMLFAFVFAGCTLELRRDYNISEISVIQETLPETIMVGDFDSAGIKAKITYTDGFEKTISVTSSLLSEEENEMINTPGTYNFTIYYQGTSSFSLRVTIVEKKYNVKFVGFDNEVLKNVYVEKGGSVEAPAIESNENYTFISWDRQFDNIQQDTTVYAIYSSVEKVDESNVYDETSNFQIHFVQTGNKYAGDCIYIKAGDNDILIDAGSRQASAKTICEYVDGFVSDNTLEYVIATHADQDHIAGFVGTSSAEGVFAHYTCKNIIDFCLSNKDTKNSSNNDTLYGKYLKLRASEVENGANRYSALDCYNNQNGGSKTYNLAENIQMEILYNYFYDHAASDENNYSVCLQFIVDGEYYLFTGDLEEEGEEYLVEYNTLCKVKFFKAGHHGSKTSSNDCLLDIIQPEICVACCCAGTKEYTEIEANKFPTQAFIDRISKWTDEVYIPTILSDNESEFELLCGTIVVYQKDDKVYVYCSNKKTKIKDTAWFKEKRTCPNTWK